MPARNRVQYLIGHLITTPLSSPTFTRLVLSLVFSTSIKLVYHTIYWCISVVTSKALPSVVKRMPLFTLPISGANGEISRAHSTSRPSKFTNIGRKRKRDASPSSTAPSQSRQPSRLQSTASSPSPSQVSTHIANPLSLNDAERAQYLLAGLPLDAELPSTSFTDFPNRGLPDDAIIDDEGGWTTAGEQAESEVKKKRVTKGSHLKLRHLGVLTTIVQRCLLEGDIKRATKAWSLLLRMQIGGRGIDLRSTGYWGIGAELLIRSGQTKPIGKKPLALYTLGEESENEGQDDDDAIRRRQQAGPPSWGSKEGIQAAKAYYERLILQHPYLRQFSGTTLSSLDFWPAMLSCEVYGIQHEYATSMAQIATTQDNGDGSDTDEMDEEDSAVDDSVDPDDYEDHQSMMEDKERRRLDRLDARREEKKNSKEWSKKEAIRRRALEAATSIATRMDELMTGPPWTDSATLLRLRGCIHLWVGDLSLPTEWPGRAEEDDDSMLDKMTRDRGKIAARAREEEDRRRAMEVGKLRRKQMREEAQLTFLKAERRGARCPEIEMEEDRDEDDIERTF